MKKLSSKSRERNTKLTHEREQHDLRRTKRNKAFKKTILQLLAKNHSDDGMLTPKEAGIRKAAYRRAMRI